MKISTRIKGSKLYVKVRAGFTEKINEPEMEGFLKKNVKRFMRPETIKKTYVEYAGRNGTTLTERLQNSITAYDLFFLVEQYIDSVERIGTAGMMAYKMLLDPDYCFYIENTKELQFIYISFEKNEKNADLSGFLEDMIYSAKPETQKDADEIFKFAHYIKAKRGFNTREIEKYIEKYDRTIVNIIKNKNMPDSGFITDSRKEYYEHKDRKEENTTVLTNDNMDDDGGTTTLEVTFDDEQTGLLTYDSYGSDDYDDEQTGLLVENSYRRQQPRQLQAKLIRVSTDDVVYIDKPVFNIGKMQGAMDYVVTDNYNISRDHASIISRGDRFFIQDHKSMNKTYLNDIALQPYEETEIHDGDNIRLANEDFNFIIEF
ncbi:MAG: FHA domain-containing protein [Oscillospiraceae bacterium]|nr:FHA domain-containing protein [Oscillospiraceae bacterium]